jgi:hypothetical protein
MKVCKVSMGKIITEGGASCTNTYPTGYDVEIMEVMAYEQEDLADGTHVSYCIALVPDDFTFTADMVEIDDAECEACINHCATHIHSGLTEQSEKDAAEAKFKASRNDKINRAKYFPITVLEKKASYAQTRNKK